MNIKSFKHNDWVKIYEGRWSFLTSSHWNDQFTKEIKFGKLPFISECIIFLKENRSAGWARQKDRGILGKYLARQVKKNPATIKILSRNLKFQAKNLIKFIGEKENTEATLKLYKEFWHRNLIYWHFHINVKYVADYLSPVQLKKYLPILQKARLVAEPVFKRTEDFLIGFTKLLGKKTGYNHNLLLCLTKEELKKYFGLNKLPKKSELKKRYQQSVFLSNCKSSHFFTGRLFQKIEKFVTQQNKSSIKGQPAFGGKAIGKVKIIFDPKETKGFTQGDILVTGSTRPEFLPIMRKAAAFVTDSGGILSHAAITAREMKKPCIIGTQIATKILKDGDMVEVDANKGMVKKLL